MDERDFRENMAKMLNTSWNAFAEPVSAKYQQLRDAEYRMEVLRDAIDKAHLVIAIATPLLIGWAFYDTRVTPKHHLNTPRQTTSTNQPAYYR